MLIQEAYLMFVFYEQRALRSHGRNFHHCEMEEDKQRLVPTAHTLCASLEETRYTSVVGRFESMLVYACLFPFKSFNYGETDPSFLSYQFCGPTSLSTPPGRTGECTQTRSVQSGQTGRKTKREERSEDTSNCPCQPLF